MNLEGALEAAAHRFAHAFVAAHEVDTGDAFTRAAIELDEATHDLVVAAGETCPYCEPGTCAADLEPELERARPVESTPPL